MDIADAKAKPEHINAQQGADMTEIIDAGHEGSVHPVLQCAVGNSGGFAEVFMIGKAAGFNCLAQALIEQPVRAILDSGAPTGDKHVLLWNPPVVNPDLGIRASARSQAFFA